MASIYNISAYQGDQIELTLNLKTSSGTYVNLSGYSVRGQVRQSYSSTGILLDLNPQIINLESGLVNIDIISNISKNIPVGEHLYDIEKYPSGDFNGNSIKLIRGKFSILPEITR
ncbi:MAG: hypothetical protein EBU90_08265 [Proteobacteria bacterium]|nr:hypothetical protein [Pseudomonadota bacterium]NBP15630.1 hypothetical protein [bacterium]